MAVAEWNEAGKSWDDDHGLLEPEQIARCGPAEIVEPFHGPVPTQIVSNGEYMPEPQTAQQRLVQARIDELADAASRKLGISRRRFLTSSGGMAAAMCRPTHCDWRSPDGACRTRQRSLVNQGGKVLPLVVGERRWASSCAFRAIDGRLKRCRSMHNIVLCVRVVRLALLHFASGARVKSCALISSRNHRSSEGLEPVATALPGQQ
jgi:hypothetical protein